MQMLVLYWTIIMKFYNLNKSLSVILSVPTFNSDFTSGKNFKKLEIQIPLQTSSSQIVEGRHRKQDDLESRTVPS